MRRRPTGRPPRRVASWAKPVPVPTPGRAARGSSRLGGQARGNGVTASGCVGVRGPGPLGWGGQVVPPPLLATRSGQGPQRRRGAPEAPLVRAGTAGRLLAVGWQCRQGRRGATLVARRPRPLRAPGVGATARGLRPPPRGAAVPLDAAPRGALLAVACWSAGSARPGMEPLSLLEGPCAGQAARQRVGACGTAGQRLAQRHAPALEG